MADPSDLNHGKKEEIGGHLVEILSANHFHPVKINLILTRACQSTSPYVKVSDLDYQFLQKFTFS